MKHFDFASAWFGSPLVKTSPHALFESGLSPDTQEFLRTVGLPSNARWFDNSCSQIMCFDSAYSLRLLLPADVSAMTWREIQAIGELRILGVFGGLFIVIDRGAKLWLVDSSDGSGMKQNVRHVDRYRNETGRPIANPSWHASVFLNSNPEAFAMCLIAYKDMREVMEREIYDFDRPAIHSAVTECRRAMASADSSALITDDSFWPQILSDVEVW